MAKQSPQRVAIIGAGWAGCAAAVRLCQAGHRVTLYEAAKTPGGRARRVSLHNRNLDNGQHILLGAYRQSLAMMRQVGIPLDQAFLRLPLEMVYPDPRADMALIAPRLPAPLHLLAGLWRASGLRRADKLALIRFSSAARWMGWQLYQDCPVTELLQRFEQTERLCQLMWHPLCIAALNTRPEQASAQVFLNVLRDSLGARRSASDMLLPRMDLSALFPEQAIRFLLQHGAKVHCQQSVRQLKHGNERSWSVQTANTQADGFDAVIIATEARNAQRLIVRSQLETAPLPAFADEAITTCYLQYDTAFQLPRAMYALKEDASRQYWGQYVFDRGQLHPDQAGLLAVVVSAPDLDITHDHAGLAAAIAHQLACELHLPALAQPLWHQVITEKKATFRCTPGLQRPDNLTALSGLLLAGDYTRGDYSATLEGAVRSGQQAAQLIISGQASF